MEQEHSVKFHQFLDKATRFSRNTASVEVEQYGLKHYHIPFLVCMAMSPGISQKGLCEKVPLDKSRVSIVVRELIGLGLAVNSSTGKIWSLNLTSKGTTAYRKAIDVTTAMDDSLFSDLSADERDTFLRLAAKISKRIDEVGEPCEADAGKS